MAQTLIIHGDRDELSYVSMPFEMYTSIANTHLWIVPNGSHRSFLGDPDKYADMYIQTALEFLQDEW